MYHKKPCIIRKYLTLKGFFGMWVQVIYTMIDSEKLFKDVNHLSMTKKKPKNHHFFLEQSTKIENKSTILYLKS